MMDEQAIVSIRQALMDWFEKTNRNLPWRKRYSPYEVWISEIMLQQTQMERGVFFFERWMKRFPDIASVAAADEREILKYWEGLGYYARARNLHKAARIMVERYGSKVPDDAETLESLPGIGSYTGAAIASIAYNRDVAVVDANVERIFTRLFDIDEPVKTSAVKKRIHRLAAELLPPSRARIFNQALMDLGGVVCTPKNPSCSECPVSMQCNALRAGTVSVRPVLLASAKTITIEMTTGILLHRKRIFIQQRMADDIWGSLWEFPGGRLENGETPENALVREYLEETGFKIKITKKITTVIHHYMQYKVVLHGYFCRLAQKSTTPDLQAAQAYRWIEPRELAEFGFPAGHRKIIAFLKNSLFEGQS